MVKAEMRWTDRMRFGWRLPILKIVIFFGVGDGLAS
jgi:hypothetical protein